MLEFQPNRREAVVQNIFLALLLVVCPGCKKEEPKEEHETLLFRDNVRGDRRSDMHFHDICGDSDSSDSVALEEYVYEHIEGEKLKEIIDRVAILSERYKDFTLEIEQTPRYDYFIVCDANSDDYFYVFVDKKTGNIGVYS